MTKEKIVILNKAKNPLFVEYKRCGQTAIQKLQIKRRSVLRLETGRHEFSMGYHNANLVILNGIKGVRDLEEIPSIADVKCKGIKLLVHDPLKTVKIVCNGNFSVAGLIENLS